jgi:hypothetical protein
MEDRAMSVPSLRNSLLVIAFGIGLLIMPSPESALGHAISTVTPAVHSGQASPCEDCSDRCDGCVRAIGCSTFCSTTGILPPPALVFVRPLGRSSPDRNRDNPVHYLAGPDPGPPKATAFL